MYDIYIGHMFLYEQGGMAQLGGVCPRTLPNNPDGTIDIDLIEKAVRADNVHFTTTEMIALEVNSYYIFSSNSSPS